jgi:hypothetical protein
VTVAVQNHHDLAVHTDALLELLADIGRAALGRCHAAADHDPVGGATRVGKRKGGGAVRRGQHQHGEQYRKCHFASHRCPGR